MDDWRRDHISRCGALIRQGRGSDFLWIVPTQRWAIALSKRLLRGSGLEASVSPPVMTLLALQEQCLGPVSALEPAVLTLALAEILESDPENFAPFLNRQGHARPGAVATLKQTHLELQRRGSGVPHSDLPTTGLAATALRRLSRALHHSEQIDSGRLEHLQRQSVTPQRLAERFGSQRAVYVDGFRTLEPPFTHALGALRAWAQEVTLIVDDDPERPTLCGHLRAALDDLAGDAEFVQVDPGADPSPIERVAQAFARDATTSASVIDAAGAIAVQVCRTPHDEVVFLARTIKCWVRDHPERPLSRVAVTFPRPELMFPLVRDVFGAWGVAHSLTAPVANLASTPLGQAALALWRVAANGAHRRDLALLARHRLWREIYDLDASVVEAEAKALRVVRGWDLWLRRATAARRHAGELARDLEQVSDETDADAAQLLRRADRLGKTVTALRAVRGDVESLSRRGTLPSALESLRDLLIKHGALERLLAGGEEVAMHLQSAAALMALVSSVIDAEWIDSRARDPSHLLRLGQRLFEETPMPNRPPDHEAVQVLLPEEVLGQPWDLICVGGLTEGAWPRTVADQPLGSDESGWPQPPDHQDDHRRQRHLFHALLRTGAKRLVLTRATMIDDVPQNPSPLLDEVAQIVGLSDGAGTAEENRRPWRVEDVRELADCLAPRELQAVIGERLSALLPSATDADLGRRLAPASRAIGNVAHGLPAVRARRSLGDDWTEWDGRIQASDLRAALAQWAEDHVWSITELEAFSGCAWRASAERLLGLSAPPAEEFGIHPLEKGLLMHGILCDFMRAWRERRGRATIARGDVEEAQRVMREVAMRRLREKPEGEMLWEVEREVVLGTDERLGLTEAFVAREAESDSELAPVHFEWGFGWTDERRAPRDVEGGAPALIIEVGGHRQRIRGIVDRVECSEDRARWAVLDYKIGNPSVTAADVEAGTHLQLPIYAMAVQEHLAPPVARTEAAALCRVGHVDRMKSLSVLYHRRGSRALPGKTRSAAEEEIKAILATARRWVDRIACSVADGSLHWTTRRRKAPCPHCDWRHVCRRDEGRAAQIGEPQLADSEGRG